MKHILKINQITNWRKTVKKNQKIVLVGGCFDVLHPGHVIFLQKAKRVGDILVVLLESDEKIKKLKGITRPVHNQDERAQVLSALAGIDYIVPLPDLKNDKSYEEIVLQIKPDIIAATAGIDDYYHKRVSKIVGAQLKYVTKMIGSYSTSRIINHKGGE